MSHLEATHLLLEVDPRLDENAVDRASEDIGTALDRKVLSEGQLFQHGGAVFRVGEIGPQSPGLVTERTEVDLAYGAPADFQRIHPAELPPLSAAEDPHIPGNAPGKEPTPGQASNAGDHERALEAPHQAQEPAPGHPVLARHGDEIKAHAAALRRRRRIMRYAAASLAMVAVALAAAGYLLYEHNYITPAKYAEIAKRAREVQRTSAEKHGLPLKVRNRLGMEFVYIPPYPDLVAAGLELPGKPQRHRQPFYLQTTEVTQEQWQRIMGHNPSRFAGADRPVDRVMFDEAQDFVKRLNEGAGRDIYRLPGFHEWHYACRGGCPGLNFWGDDPGEASRYAWEKSEDGTHPVARKKPNSWGLYDLYGNVWEYTGDGGASGDGLVVSIPEPGFGTVVFRGGNYVCATHTGPFPKGSHFFQQGGLRLLLTEPGARLAANAPLPQPPPAASTGPKTITNSIGADHKPQAETKPENNAKKIVLAKPTGPHFIKNTNGVITDQETGLQWFVGPDKDTNWHQAKKWATGLKAAGGGWRMPTSIELRGLYQKGNGKRDIEPIFKHTGSRVWSGDHRGSTALAIYFPGAGGDYNNVNYSDGGRAFAVRYLTKTSTKPAKPTKTVPKGKRFTNSIGMEFVRIPAGSFMMGSDKGEDDERPVHKVTISRPFYMQTTEVTQGQWKAVMGGDPSRFKKCGDGCPVEQVSWKDAQEFIHRLNQKEGTTKYRLPTEAQWECAARAGSPKAYCFGDYDSRLGQYAWYYANSEKRTRPVAKKKANAWGLFDMHGNVAEWCRDWYGPYPSGPVSDPSGPAHGSKRVQRGGHWGCIEPYIRSASRGWALPNNAHETCGFRLVVEE